MPSVKKLEYWLIFHRDRLLISKEDNARLLTDITAAPLSLHFIRQHTLIQLENTIVFCAELANESEIPHTMDIVPLRKALELLGTDWYNLAAKAYSIITWDKNHAFCGRCGHQTILQTAEHPGIFERACITCGLVFYPRISPSIIVLIHRQHEILMARSRHFTPGIYGLIAGFIEAGESVEDAVHREVAEEVNLKIKNLRYFSSQAWPFPDSLMIAFIAEYAGGELQINPAEIEDAGWYPIDHLPSISPSPISITKKLIEYFKGHHQHGLK